MITIQDPIRGNKEEVEQCLVMPVSRATYLLAYVENGSLSLVYCSKVGKTYVADNYEGADIPVKQWAKFKKFVNGLEL